MRTDGVVQLFMLFSFPLRLSRGYADLWTSGRDLSTGESLSALRDLRPSLKSIEPGERTVISKHYIAAELNGEAVAVESGRGS